MEWQSLNDFQRGRLVRCIRSRDWSPQRALSRNHLWLFRPEKGNGDTVLGNKVRRGSAATAFLLVGLLTTWASCWVGSRMSYRLPLKPLFRGSGNCNEIGWCSEPWWIIAAFLAYLFGPSIVFAVTGWVSVRDGTQRRTVALRLALLIGLTALFYLAGYATGP